MIPGLFLKVTPAGCSGNDDQAETEVDANNEPDLIELLARFRPLFSDYRFF